MDFEVSTKFILPTLTFLVIRLPLTSRGLIRQSNLFWYYGFRLVTSNTRPTRGSNVSREKMSIPYNSFKICLNTENTNILANR